MITVSLEHANEGSLLLQEEGMALPFRGVLYQPTTSPGETVEDALTLALESASPAQVSEGICSVERYLNLARAASQTQNGKPVYLSCVAAAGEPSWRSQLLGGWLEQVGGQRALGSVGLKLHITRENAWEGPETALPLSNPNGSRLTGGLTLFSSVSPSGYDNYIEIAGEDIAGGLPARARLELVNQGITSLAYLFCAFDRSPLHGEFFAPWFEGEDAIGGVTIDHPGCSRGKAQLASWSGSDPADLLTWAMPFLATGQAGGRYFKAILRIPAGTAYTDLSLRLVVRVAGSRVWEGAWEAVPAGKELVELNILPLPPYLAGVETLASITFTMQARREAGGEHQLLVDSLHLLPLDGWRRLVSAGDGAPPGYTLYDDSFQGYAYFGQGPFLQTDFSASGDPICLYPGSTQRLYILAMDDMGQAAPGHALQARLYYRPRVRQL